MEQETYISVTTSLSSGETLALKLGVTFYYDACNKWQ
jgi:hypothetical protein